MNPRGIFITITSTPIGRQVSNPRAYTYPNSQPLRGSRFSRALALSLLVNLPSRKS